MTTRPPHNAKPKNTPEPAAPKATPAKAAPAKASATAAPHKDIKFIIAALMLSMLMSSLGQTIFATALPTIVGDLGGANHMSWVITTFLLGQTIALPIFGKIGDQIGRKGLFLFANVLFMSGSAIGALSTSMSMLIIGRAVQGVAGGALMILSQAITAEVTTARERSKYMGIMGSVFGVSAVLGPLLGGWFTDGPGWRWGMWFNIPIGLASFIATVIFLKLPRRERGKLQLDWLGTITMAISTAALVLFVTWGGNEHPWTSPLILSLIAIFVVFAILFVLIELRAKNPLVPMTLFKTRNFVLTTIVGLGVGVFMFGSLAYLPTYLQMVHAMTPTQAGLMIIPMMVGVMGTSISVGAIIARTGRYRIYPIVGMVITSLGLVLLSFLTPDTSLWVLGIYLFIYGFGVGCTMQVLVLIVQNSFPLSMVGTATGANNFFRQIGGSLGSALVGGLFTSGVVNNLAKNVPPAIASLGDKGAAVTQQFQELGSASRLTPHLVMNLPEPVRSAIQLAYNDALTPVFLILAPLALLCAAVAWAVREEKLSKTLS